MSPPHDTLLFLPGASGEVAFWRPVADRLSHPGTRRFVGYPGLGGAPADPCVTAFADLVTHVVHQLGDTADGPSGPADERSAQTILFAQSMGGLIALRAALERPDRVRCLVLSATSGGLDVGALGAADWRPDHRLEHPGTPDWFLDERQDLSDRLGEIVAPVLLLWGDADPYSPVAVGRRLAELLPCAELVVIEGGRHGLARDRAADVLPHIERHLAQLTGRCDA